MCEALLNGSYGHINTRRKFWPSPPHQVRISNTSNGMAGGGVESTLRFILSLTQRIRLQAQQETINQVNSMAYPAKFPGCASWRAIGTLLCSTRTKIGPDVMRPKKPVPGESPLRSTEERFDTRFRHPCQAAPNIEYLSEPHRLKPAPLTPFDVRVRALLVCLLMPRRMNVHGLPCGRCE